MPKRSRADTKLTIQKILDAVADQLLHLGYDKMSYTTLSQQTGISRTGISHHFPKKHDFVIALYSRIFNMFVSHLIVDRQLSEFRSSWEQSLSNPEFLSLFRVMFHNVIAGDKKVTLAQQGIEKLYDLMDERFGAESKKELEGLIGKSLIRISFRV